MITSTSNKQVKHIVQLQKKARMRREENVFIAEGPRMVMETPKDMLQEIYVFMRENCIKLQKQQQVPGMQQRGQRLIWRKSMQECRKV